MASEFLQDYIFACKERNIEPHDGIVQCLHRPCASPGATGKARLSLCATSLDQQTCAVLGKILSTDHYFEEIDLHDCSLPEAAVVNLLCGLNTNTACERLNLKGNNIKGNAVECLGRLLRQNKHLQSLVLEWNNVGMLDEAFMVFCEGLGGSTSLLSLDLRNNQISHHGANELATCLKRNTTLRKLDLRWNNIGLVGGRALLEAFKFNKTLSNIELNGNDIPMELVRSIENSARNNDEIHKLSNEYQHRTSTLASSLRKSQQDHARQKDDLINRLDEKEETLRKTNRYASQKVEHFKGLLEERKSAFSTIASKLARVESDLLLSEQQNKDLEILLEKERSDKEVLASSYRTEIRTASDQHLIMENRLSLQLTEASEKNNEYLAELGELRSKTDNQTKQINELKEFIANLEADGRIASTNHQDRLKKEQLKHAQTMREFNVNKDKELEQVRNDQSVVEKSLRDHIAKVETQRRDADEEIGRLKAQLIADRSKHEDELSQTRQKLKADQDFHMSHMEEKLRMVHSAKNEMQQMSSQQACVISDLQTKNGTLSMNVDNLKHQVEQLQQGINSKQSDIEAAKQKVQRKMDQKVQELDAEMDRLRTTNEKLVATNKKLDEEIRNLQSESNKKSEDIKHLKEKVSMREADIAWMREETTQRALALQTAVRNYAQPLSSSS